MENSSSASYDASTNASFLPGASRSTDFQIAFAMQQYLFIILVIFGTIGHVLTFVVLSRPRMRYTSIYSYLFALSCADAIVLWMSCFKVWVRLITGFELLHASTAACKIVTFCYLFSTYLSSWLIVAMTADRFTAVWFPLKASLLCSVRHARISTFGLALLAIVSNIHVFWTYGHNEFNQCTFLYMGVHYKFLIFEYMKLAAYCFVPFIVVLSLNAAIIYKLKWGSKYLRRTDPQGSSSTAENGGGGGGGGAGNYDRIVYLLLTVSFTWFVLTLPVSLLGFVDFLHDTKVARTVCFILMYANHSVNFYLYCITGRKFRHELHDAFRCHAKTFRSKLRLSNGTETTRTAKSEPIEKIPLTVMAHGRDTSNATHV